MVSFAKDFILAIFLASPLHAIFDDEDFTPPQTQLAVNEIVAAMSQKVYAKINENWQYPKPHRRLYTDSYHWDVRNVQRRTFIDGGLDNVSVSTMVLMGSEDKLDEALIDLISRPATLECGIALVTVKLCCLRALLGREHFKSYARAFNAVIQNHQHLGPDDFFHEFGMQFLKRGLGVTTPGSLCYIANIPHYSQIKPHGNGTGSNLICTSINTYIGFSDIYKSGPQPLDVIQEQDFHLFLQTDDVERYGDGHRQLSECFRLFPQTFVHMHLNAQEPYNFHMIFDLTTLERFRQTGEVIL